MPPISHPSELSPEQRRRELVGIFAAGVLRLRKRRLFGEGPAGSPREFSADSAAGALMTPRKSCSVDTTVNGQRGQ
jgi:hypothetical protein